MYQLFFLCNYAEIFGAVSVRFYIEFNRGSHDLPPALTSAQKTEPEGPGGKNLHKLVVLQATVEFQVQIV